VASALVAGFSAVADVAARHDAKKTDVTTMRGAIIVRPPSIGTAFSRPARRHIGPETGDDLKRVGKAELP
jgi:hypothetical protein